jgi:hypothetical protein
MPVPEIATVKGDLVSRMGLLAGGKPLHTLIMVDASWSSPASCSPAMWG